MEQPEHKHLGLLMWIAVAVVLGAGLVHAITLFWTCDDAFITFRYADNLIAGKGLVYNEVERVEGYSNFLWTLLIAAARIVTDADAARLGNWLGMAFYVATLLLLVRASRWIGGAVALPVAAAGLSAHYHFKVFASCGLETAMVTFLATALLLQVIRARTGRDFLVAGLLGTLVALTRADGPFVYGLMGLFVLGLSIQQRSWRPFVAMVLPGLLIWVPYFAWRWNYYGDPLPNVFYAKSVAQAYPSQGLHYVRMFFTCYWILVPAVIGMLVLALRRGTCQRAAAATATLALPFIAFIVWAGGDFMFARYLIPITPALYLALELLGNPIRSRNRKAVYVLAVAACSLLMLYPKDEIQKLPADSRYGIFEERWIYTPAFTDEARTTGQHFAKLTRGTKAGLAILGGQASIAYYGRFYLVIECATGLTDRTVARQEVEVRGRIGHEKVASNAYVISRGVNFALFPPHIIGFDHPLDARLRSLKVGQLELTIVTWSREIMRRLRNVDSVAFTEVEAFLDAYLATADTKTKEQLGADFDYFQKFYFDHNEDPERRARFAAVLR